MVDISSILGANQVRNVILAQQLQSFLSNNFIPPIPGALVNAQPGQTVTVFVQAVNNSNQALLTTPKGPVVVSSNIELKPGQQLSLEILPAPPGSGGFEARIVRIDGEPLPDTLFLSNKDTDIDKATRPAVQNTAIVRSIIPEGVLAKSSELAAESSQVSDVTHRSIQDNSIFRAQVINAPIPTEIQKQANLQVINQLRTGDAITFRIVPGSIVLPSTSATPSPSANAVLPSIVVSLSAPTSNFAEPSKTFLSAAQSVASLGAIDADIAGDVMGDKALGTNPQGKIAHTIVTAAIIGEDKGGEPIAITALGTLRLPDSLSFSKGTVMQIEILQLESQGQSVLHNYLPTLLTSGHIATDALIKNSTGFDSLIRYLASSNAALAAQLTEQILPQPGKQFAGKLFWFLSASSTRPIEETLEKNIPQELAKEIDLAKFIQDFKAIKQGDENQRNNSLWNYALVPIWDGQDVQHIRWFSRQQQSHDGSGRKEKGTRFVVELSTEEMGALQLDGFISSTNKESYQFDLTVRSHDNFTAEQIRDIRDIFNNYAEIVGYNGAIKFEAMDNFPASPLEEIVAPRPPGISV